MYWLWLWLWLWLWMALTAGVMITSHITKARGDKPSRALWEAIVANLIFGALLAPCKQIPTPHLAAIDWRKAVLGAEVSGRKKRLAHFDEP